VLIVLLIVSGVLLSRFLVQVPKAKFSFKAAIIDQLSDEYQNPDFNSTGPVATALRDSGFSVSYFESSKVNVAFYRNLAKDNYGLIVLRSHAALRVGETLVDFFTSEEFNENRYSAEINDGLLAKGYYSWKPNKSYFTITPKFIEHLEGSFPKSFIVAMGCNSLNASTVEMAEAFIGKGATAYVGWTGLVDPTHTDDQTIKLLQAFLKENKTLREALDTLHRDPTYGSLMECFPPTADDLRLSDLTAESNDYAILGASASDSRPFLVVLGRDATVRGSEVPALCRAKQVYQAFKPPRDAYV
jgi:hypothetical protein